MTSTGWSSQFENICTKSCDQIDRSLHQQRIDYFQIHIWIIYLSLEIDIDSVFCEGGEDVGRQDQFGDVVDTLTRCVSEVFRSPRRLDVSVFSWQQSTDGRLMHWGCWTLWGIGCLSRSMPVGGREVLKMSSYAHEVQMEDVLRMLLWRWTGVPEVEQRYPTHLQRGQWRQNFTFENALKATHLWHGYNNASKATYVWNGNNNASTATHLWKDNPAEVEVNTKYRGNVGVQGGSNQHLGATNLKWTKMWWKIYFLIIHTCCSSDRRSSFCWSWSKLLQAPRESQTRMLPTWGQKIPVCATIKSVGFCLGC